MLVRLMYASRAAANLDNEEVTTILRRSRTTNARGASPARCACATAGASSSRCSKAGATR